MRTFPIVASLLALFASLPAQDRRTDAIRIGTWNLEQFGFRQPPRSEESYGHIAGFVAELGVDVLAVQEIGGAAALGRVTAALGRDWQYVLGTTGGFRDGTGAIHVGFLWNSARVELLSAGELLDLPRDVDGVPIFHRVPVTACFRSRDGGIDFRAVTVHLKASRGELNERKRSLEVAALRDWLQKTLAIEGEDQDIVVLGDFNHTYDAPAYQVFLDGETVRYLRPAHLSPTIIHFDDPIDQIAVTADFDEVGEPSFRVHNEQALKDRDAWRSVYSDHMPVTVDLDARVDRDPEATFAELPAEQRLPRGPFAARARGERLNVGDAVIVYLRDAQAQRGVLTRWLDDWIHLRDDDGKLVAIPVQSVVFVKQK